MVFHWRLSDSKSAHVSRTLHSILPDLSNAVYINLLGVVPSAPTTIGATITFRFYSFFVLKQGLNIYLFLLSLNFYLWFAETSKSDIRPVLFFCCWLSLGLVVWPRSSDPFVSQNPSFYVLFSRRDFGFFIYYFFVRSKFNFLHNSQLIIFPPCRVLSYPLFEQFCCIR